MVGQNGTSPKKCILSYEKILTWHEKTLGRMFYPLFGQENCFSLAALGLKQPFSLPTIGKNKFLPLVFPCLAKFFHMTGIYILPFNLGWLCQMGGSLFANRRPRGTWPMAQISRGPRILRHAKLWYYFDPVRSSGQRKNWRLRLGV